MPPLYQDPLSAVPGAWRWIDLARALVEVSAEPWALALVALAVFSYLETDVKGVLKVFFPLGLALLAAAGVALAARAVAGAARPLDGGALAFAPLLRRAFPSAQGAAVVAFAVYAALVYRRRAVLAVVPAALVGLAHALAGPHWRAELAGGGAAGLALAAGAYGLARRLSGDSELERRRTRRPTGPAPAGPGSP